MTTAVAAMANAAHQLTPTSLNQVAAVADLQTRTDRKYLLPTADWRELISRFHDRLHVLEISGLRQFDYESVYFDTAGLLAYRRHAYGRRTRFKIRTRSYLDSAQTTLELKARGGRGETVKHRYQYRIEDRYQLDPDARELVGQRLGLQVAGQDPQPALITNYLRTTLLDPVSGSRLTCDVGLRFSDSVRQHRAPDDLVLVESKTTGSATPVETTLWRLGHRPVSISKYCTGLALLHPDLPANRWNRTLRRYFGWQPLRRRSSTSVDAHTEREQNEPGNGQNHQHPTGSSV